MIRSWHKRVKLNQRVGYLVVILSCSSCRIFMRDFAESSSTLNVCVGQ